MAAWPCALRPTNRSRFAWRKQRLRCEERLPFTRAGYGPDDVAMVRDGTIYNREPNAVTPQLSGYLVGDCEPDERETLSEGLHLMTTRGQECAAARRTA